MFYTFILIVYAVISFCFLVFSIFNFYHMWRFGGFTVVNFLMIGFYTVALILWFIFSFRFIGSYMNGGGF